MKEPARIEHSHPWGEAETPYLEIGGDDGVRRLSNAFYDRVERDSPELRAMLPRDTSASRQKLYEFLSGWMGGPQLYQVKRGHPRLRMRHLPFPIGDREAAEWMRCMESAMEDVSLDGALRDYLSAQFQMSALHMRNQ